MFGSDKPAGDLEARVAALEARVEALLSAQGGAVANGAAGIVPRRLVQFDMVYQAPETGYLTLWSGWGGSDRCVILAGPVSPPTEELGMLNTMKNLNTYIGAVIRRGEYFCVTSEATRVGRESGVTAHFTPFL